MSEDTTEEASETVADTATDGQSADADAPVVDESAVPRIEEVECANCGAPIASDATTCPDCGTAQSAVTGQSHGTDQTANNDQTTTTQTGQTDQSGKDIEPLFSAILSFLLPGIGQIYHGQSERGIVIFAGWIGWWLILGLAFLLLTVVTLGLGVITIIFLPVVDLLYHVVAAADAYVQGEKIASGEKQV